MTITIPRETFDAMRDALEVLNHLDADINFLNTNELEEMMDKALSAARAVSEDKREAVTITSVKMVGGVAPEAELMRQAIAQLEGMGYRVEQDKAVSEPKVKLIPTAEDMGAPKLGAAVGELASPEYDQLRARVQPTITNSESRSSIAHLRARTSQHKWNSYELCQADDPNGIAVYTHPQASEPAWMPIETAPKSEEVLLFATKSRPHAFIGYWGEYNRHNQPSITHWMPLPAPPKDDL